MPRRKDKKFAPKRRQEGGEEEQRVEIDAEGGIVFGDEFGDNGDDTTLNISDKPEDTFENDREFEEIVDDKTWRKLCRQRMLMQKEGEK